MSPADRMMSDAAVQALRSIASDVIQAAVNTPMDSTTYGLALGIVSLVLDRDARCEVEAATVKQLNETGLEVARLTQLLAALAAPPGVTH